MTYLIVFGEQMFERQIDTRRSGRGGAGAGPDQPAVVQHTHTQPGARQTQRRCGQSEQQTEVPRQRTLWDHNTPHHTTTNE